MPKLVSLNEKGLVLIKFDKNMIPPTNVTTLKNSKYILVDETTEKEIRDVDEIIEDDVKAEEDEKVEDDVKAEEEEKVEDDVEARRLY